LVGRNAVCRRRTDRRPRSRFCLRRFRQLTSARNELGHDRTLQIR
jgi:hypothetical protein